MASAGAVPHMSGLVAQRIGGSVYPTDAVKSFVVRAFMLLDKMPKVSNRATIMKVDLVNFM